MKRGKFNIVIGGQAGSESKGKLAAFLAAKFKPVVISMTASPNAGHTAIIEGEKFVTYHLPVSWVAHRSAIIILGPASVIRVPILMDEIARLGVPPTNLFIHPRAVVIRDHYLHVEREEGLLKIGSTNQGVGVARREKLMRVDDITYAADIEELKPYIANTVTTINGLLDAGCTVLHEMTQGFDLCLEHGIDSHYCTSKMVVPAMAMAEAGVSPSMLGDVYGVIRPYPIRVNNREGSSGPYAEAKEITWEEVGRRSGHPDPASIAEITTTTKLPRRVFEFSEQRLKHFATICRPTRMCIQFTNYLDHTIRDQTLYGNYPKVHEFMNKVEGICHCPVAYLGTGPDNKHMIDFGMDECGERI